MANYNDGSYLTESGRSLLARILATEKKLKYTKVTVGNGELPSGQSPVQRTALVNQIMNANLYAISNPHDGEVSVQAQVSSTNVPTGFYVKEIGLWAEDPTTGAEVLYTYVLMNNDPEWIRPASAAVGKLATFEIISTVETTDEVVAVVDTASLAHLSDVQNVINRLLGVSLSLTADGGIIAEFPDTI